MPISPPVHTPPGHDAHRAAIRRDHNTTSSSLYDNVWRKLRATFIRNNPLCQPCLDAGRVTAAQQVHHVVAIADAPDRRLDSSNLMSICKRCHSALTANERWHPKQR